MKRTVISIAVDGIVGVRKQIVDLDEELGGGEG